jgi:hypothetical protein
MTRLAPDCRFLRDDAAPGALAEVMATCGPAHPFGEVRRWAKSFEREFHAA